MKLFHPVRSGALAGILVVALATPAISFAEDHEHQHWQHREISAQERQEWIKQHLDKEAAMLEIKASQESAWAAYASAATELGSAYGNRKPPPPNTDAAATMRLHADQAATFAQNLAKLAEATEKLQSVLNEDQRKVLDRIVRLQSQFHGRHHGDRWSDREDRPHEADRPSGAAKAAPKAAPPAKAKN